LLNQVGPAHENRRNYPNWLRNLPLQHGRLCPLGTCGRARAAGTDFALRGWRRPTRLRARMTANGGFRVVHVFPDSARLSCGPCNAILAIMESQQNHGMDVKGISPVDQNIPVAQCQRIEHLPIREVDFGAADFASTALAARAEGRGAIFHFHGIASRTNQLARKLKQAGIPYVFTSHGQLLYHGFTHGLKKLIYLNLVSRFIRDAGGLHFLTQREADRARYLLPTWRGSLLVHHNLVRVPDPASVRPRSRQELSIPTDAFVFAYLGRLHVEHKGLDLLVKAFARIATQANAYLVLVGPDWAGGRQILEQLASQLGCGERMRFLGTQIGEAKWSALRMADAFVSPSRWEACSLAQAEAIGFGLPTILSTRVNIAPEAVERGSALASPLSAAALARTMQQLIENSQLRRSLSELGRQWVLQTCSFETAGACFEEFYQRVLDRR
jgi:glycosyltransferase involved in cell wall biosynthesis